MVPPLHLAAIEGQLEAARWLLEHGPALDVPDDEFGMTPSAWANEEGREAKLDLFLSQGAVITPFEAAAFAKLDVDLRHRSRQGFTPLEIAERQAKDGRRHAPIVLDDRKAAIERDCGRIVERLHGAGDVA
jgi:ankyrin repeat protein